MTRAGHLLAGVRTDPTDPVVVADQGGDAVPCLDLPPVSTEATKLVRGSSTGKSGMQNVFKSAKINLPGLKSRVSRSGYDRFVLMKPAKPRDVMLMPFKGFLALK